VTDRIQKEHEKQSRIVAQYQQEQNRAAYKLRKDWNGYVGDTDLYKATMNASQRSNEKAKQRALKGANIIYYD